MPFDVQLKFSLTAKDDKGAASSNDAILTITIKHINRPPVANAGTDREIDREAVDNQVSEPKLV